MKPIGVRALIPTSLTTIQTSQLRCLALLLMVIAAPPAAAADVEQAAKRIVERTNAFRQAQDLKPQAGIPRSSRRRAISPPSWRGLESTATLPPSAISDIDWHAGEVSVRLTREELKQAPEAH